MTTDLIFDAMEYIDDDLLEAVNGLRMQKTSAPRTHWTRWGAIAACLLLLVGGVWRVSRAFGSDSAALEDAAPECENQEAIPPYVSMSVRRDDGKAVIQDREQIAAVYALLQTAFTEDDDADSTPQDEAAVDKSTGEGTPAETKPVTEDYGHLTDDRYGSVGDGIFDITFLDAAGNPHVYHVSGSRLLDMETGVSVTLTEEEIKAIASLLDSD